MNEYPSLAIAARFEGREARVARVRLVVAEGNMKSPSFFAVDFVGAAELAFPPMNSSASARVPNFLYFALRDQLAVLDGSS